jgi:hypothetical protein
MIFCTLHSANRSSDRVDQSNPADAFSQDFHFGILARASIQQTGSFASTFLQPRRPQQAGCAFRMARLLSWFGERPGQSLTPGDIERRLAGEEWTPATLSRHRSLLSLVFRLAVAREK